MRDWKPKPPPPHESCVFLLFGLIQDYKWEADRGQSEEKTGDTDGRKFALVKGIVH